MALCRSAARWWIALAGLGGCLLIAVVQSSYGGGFSPRLGVSTYNLLDPALATGHMVLVLAGLAAIAPATWWWRRGDPAAVRLPEKKGRPDDPGRAVAR